MNNEMKEFDPNSLIESVRERIRGEIASLIPQDQLNSMIQNETQKFMYGSKDRYGNKQTSGFETMFKEVIEADLKQKMQDYLKSPEYQDTWDSKGQHVCAEAVKKIIIDNSGEVMVAMFGGMFSSMLSQFKSQLNMR